jgi:hypothetical protein
LSSSLSFFFFLFFFLSSLFLSFLCRGSSHRLCLSLLFLLLSFLSFLFIPVYLYQSFEEF